MNRLTLELLFQIIGVGSASGLIFDHSVLNIISDNSSYLYEYETKSANLKRHPLLENPAENIAKKIKPDFEAITSYADTLYLFGSGSTVNRNKMVKVNAKTKKVVSVVDISDLYAAMQTFAGLSSENFNIEGVAYNGKSWYFFNRGNGTTGKNIVFTIEGKNLVDDFNIIFSELKLPKIKGVRTGFTDATLVQDKLYFLAAAEDTNSTYNDGAVLGSVIGRIDIEKMKIDFTRTITDTHKFEGLTLYADSEAEISFLLCEDNDTEKLQADIYRLRLKK
ncbi:hypothetical protein E6C50_11230 [Flavobacterium supellecticarium]|uniref:Uncharacterized protein n=1 Tax=Flavobacterium supellecticarium TaxID=2565924 RepID=A0A4S3ZVX3_9FLAO|nr:hypothetical protein [Flavobacterium supellecticarium]THF49917.1 hypothetical protein E6C50_11230 [Flavobacterium supellecticarium]